MNNHFFHLLILSSAGVPTGSPNPSHIVSEGLPHVVEIVVIKSRMRIGMVRKRHLGKDVTLTHEVCLS